MSLSRSADARNEATAPSRPEPPPALVVHEALRTLGGRRVLDGVSLTVPRAVIVALVGPNGAGKSSLLRAIAGRLRLDAGHATIAGLAPRAARAGGRLGVVPQDLALYPHLTVRENLLVFGQLSGLAGAGLITRLDEALHWAGLAERAASLVRELSGGMRRRVNLVGGVLHRPDLLLLDEPTVGVDSDARARLHALLRDLRADGMAVLVATHDLDEAADIADEVVLMTEGRVRASGPPSALVASAFPRGAELSLTVEAGRSDSAAAILAADGFRRTAAHAWIRPAEGGVGELALTAQQLREAGVELAETRLTAPTLRGAVAVLLGEAGEHRP